MSGFEVGQVVVCVNAEGLEDHARIGRVPVEGGVYTVRAVEIRDGEVALTLAEIVNQVLEWPGGNVGEVAFLASRFRPAKRTSLEDFEKLLAPAPAIRTRKPDPVA
jgi:hypothetical protein